MFLFYVSGFGFGHLTRSLAVMEALLLQSPALRVVVRCHPDQMGLAGDYLRHFGRRVELTPFVSQFRIVFDEAAWSIDEAATKAEVLRWAEGIEDSVKEEIRRFPEGIRAVVSDIVPEAFAVAKAAAVPGIAVSNYTWYEVARGFCGEASLTGLRDVYAQADVLFEYGLSTGMELPIGNRVPVGLVCRPIDPAKVAAIRGRYKEEARPLVFLSVGGALSLEKLTLCPDFDYLCTRGIKVPEGISAAEVPAGAVDTQNYLAACDAVITKCGWSTVAESLIAGKPLFLIRSANGWVEEKYILKQVREWGAAVEIEAADLPTMACLPMQPQRQSFPNNVQTLANQILQYR